MSQLGEKVMSFDQDKSNDLFDVQRVLDSMPYGVGLFDQSLKLRKWNNSFFAIFEEKSIEVAEQQSINDIFNLSLENKELQQENDNMLSLISEMYGEANPNSPSIGSISFIWMMQNLSKLMLSFFLLKG